MDNFKVVWSVKSECGPVRKKNEDAAYPNISGSGMLPFKAGVFDGMGGHKKGEVASEIASSVMNEEFNDLVSYVKNGTNIVYLVDEKFNISSLKKYIINSHYSFLTDLLLSLIHI